MRRSATDGVTAEADLAQCGALALPPPFLFLWLLVQFFFTAPLFGRDPHTNDKVVTEKDASRNAGVAA